VHGRFGAVIVTVNKIVPGAAKSLADVTPQIRKQIATERAKEEVHSLHEKIEDERAGGATLPQIAEKLKLTVATYDVDRSGRDPNGKVVNFAHAGQVIPTAFNSDVGVDNDPIEVDDGYIWYNVASITPSRDRTLDEVKDQVEARWREDQIADRLKVKSAELLDKLKAGTPFDTVAAGAGLKIQTADKLTRSKPEAGLSPRVVTAVFRTAKDAYGSAEGDQQSGWVLFRVTDITTLKFDPDSADMKRIADVLKKQQSEEILEQYMAWLRNDLGTSVNQAAIAQALGETEPDTN
jgi:peptidyl-prolyl cis-trans isomerase D